MQLLRRGARHLSAKDLPKIGEVFFMYCGSVSSGWIGRRIPDSGEGMLEDMAEDVQKML